MSRVFFAYVEGSDLEDLEDVLCEAFEAFIHRQLPQAWLVNNRHEDDDTLRSGDLADWELGLNFVLTDDAEVDLDRIEAVARFLNTLARRCNREFVLGLGDDETRVSEDIVYIGAEPTDIGALRRAFA